jgi:hypothetical protein
MKALILVTILLQIVGCATAVVPNDLRACSRACNSGELQMFKDLDVTCVCKKHDLELDREHE